MMLSDVKMVKSLDGLPPKLKIFRGKINSRKQLQVKKFVTENPFTSNEEIVTALDLNVHSTP